MPQHALQYSQCPNRTNMNSLPGKLVNTKYVHNAAMTSDMAMHSIMNAR